MAKKRKKKSAGKKTIIALIIIAVLIAAGYFGVQHLKRLQRARAQHGYRFADDEKNRDEELGHWFYGEDRELDAQIQRFETARRAWYARCSRTMRTRTSFRMGSICDGLRFSSQRA